jgi:hypothetical protein
MPRPKVLPANRLRAPEACIACRASKKRCSGTFPCTKCIRNGRADTCVPFRRSNPTSTPRQTNNSYKALNSPPSQDAGRQARSSLSIAPDRLPQLLPAPGTSGAPHKTHSRMLRNRQGERGNTLLVVKGFLKVITNVIVVYIGRAASLSFLQLLRDTVTQHIGPSQFSHNVRREDMLETDTPDEVPQSFQSDLNIIQEQAFLRTYCIAVRH